MLTVSAMHPRAKVLVVEDEEPLALLLRYNLEAEGYAVDVVHRGDEAEVAIAESSPDLIVLDWMLPGLSGLELCRRLRTGKDSRTIRPVLATGIVRESLPVRKRRQSSSPERPGSNQSSTMRSGELSAMATSASSPRCTTSTA